VIVGRVAAADKGKLMVVPSDIGVPLIAYI
jgi:hypothetical protein